MYLRNGLMIMSICLLLTSCVKSVMAKDGAWPGCLVYSNVEQVEEELICIVRFGERRWK